MSKTVYGSYDPAWWINQQIPELPELSFDRLEWSHEPGDPAISNWQQRIRERFALRLGVDGTSTCDLNIRPLGKPVDVDGKYTREEYSFDSRFGLPVFAYVLTPKVDGPHPILMCFHGHGHGVNAVVGLDEAGEPIVGDEYHHAFAVQAVMRGYVVVAIEIIGFGRRRLGTNCQIPSGAALMLGQTMAGWRAYDAMRAIDFAHMLPNVDFGRIAAMGISGGGLNTLFLAALDRRVKAAVVSGYVNEFTSSVMSIDHCIDNFIPGLRLDMEMTDIAGSIAPRALWCENGTDDCIFPLAAFHRAIAKTREIYASVGVPDHIYGHVFTGEHQFDGTGCWEFLETRV